jgi:hypothetical protein
LGSRTLTLVLAQPVGDYLEFTEPPPLKVIRGVELYVRLVNFCTVRDFVIWPCHFVIVLLYIVLSRFVLRSLRPYITWPILNF